MTATRRNAALSGSNGKAIRRDLAAAVPGSGSPPGQGSTPEPSGDGWHAKWVRWSIAAGFAVLMIVFSAIPLSIGFSGHSNKDYTLWYQVGEALRQGINIYPDPASGRLFPFMYPPSAAAMLGFVSLLGKHGTLIFLVLGHSLAWLGAVGLSVWLAKGGPSGRVWKQHPLLYIVPSMCIIALVHNTYLLGQPNLALLTLLLLAFACLRQGREISAGVLVATAAAIKAFPILALGYLVYRRMWKASAATIVALLVWLLVVPLPFRTPAQAIQDLSVWSRGMVFTYNSHGIAQRPFRSYSYKNQSIMALTHRLLRDVPADGEKALSQFLAQQRVRQAASEQPAVEQAGAEAASAIGSKPMDLATMLATPGRAPDLTARFAGVEPALKRAWRVNVAALDFRVVTVVTLACMLGLSLFVLAVMPPQSARNAGTDALEFSLITLLIVMFSPLSFNYAYVWMIFPLTVALDRVLSEPLKGRWRVAELAWLGTVLVIPGLAVLAPLYAQAYGNLFVPSLLLVIGLGLRLLASPYRRVTDDHLTVREGAAAGRLSVFQ